MDEKRKETVGGKGRASREKRKEMGKDGLLGRHFRKGFEKKGQL